MSESDDPERSERTQQHQRNQSLEELLDELNSLLNYAELQVEEEFESPRWPVVFIVGPPRSGTTLLLQWLAQTGIFGYPTNLISRFYAAPYIGAKIQRLLTDPEFDFNDEFQDLRQSIGFNSTLGKTQGLLAPNEFWYFWRRFIPNEEPRYLEPEEVQQVDQKGFAASLAALESALGKPLVMKGLIVQYNLKVIAETLRRGALFIQTHRHPFYNIQSLLKARRSYYDTEKKWYSVKPEEYERLSDLSPAEQVAGQVYFTNQSISRQLGYVSDDQKLRLSYESFCRNPKIVYSELEEKLRGQGVSLSQEYNGPAEFESTNQIRVSQKRKSDLVAAWNRFSEEPLDI
jgi:hypothetical protein